MNNKDKIWSRFLVNDLITDKGRLFKVISINDEEYQLKVIVGHCENKVYTVEKERVEMLTIPYNINNPGTKVVNDGICHCEYCHKELVLGDPCVRYDYDVYCDEECVITHLNIEEGNIEINDLDDSKTRVVPLFELTKEQLDTINDKDIIGE